MSSLDDAIAGAIRANIQGVKDVQVSSPAGGHFEIAVTSPAFDGLNTLERHRLVLNAIKELMAGDAAPVHAVDSIRCKTA
ncbi:MAG: BolA family transcriptional regulator [Myxococcales bacterium]|nr:BolA family transcriptional regulator [Myxococcales bacterium]